MTRSASQQVYVVGSPPQRRLAESASSHVARPIPKDEKMGPLSARFFLENWLAHDFLHMRQINRRKYEYLRAHVGNALDYAGDW